MEKRHIAGAVVAYIGALALFLQVPPINLTPLSPTLVVPLAPATVQGTVIKLIPQDRNVIVGNEFTLTIAVNAAQLVNAVGATITFPKEYLEVVKLSKENSVLNFWSEEPSFSNETGTVFFSGISTAGGVKGKRTALTVVLKSKKVGSAPVNFVNAQILAHDGLGTDITGEKIGALITITDKPPPPPADINGDGKIGLADLSIVVFYFGKTDASAAKYDFSGDGKVNLTDLSILVSMIK